MTEIILGFAVVGAIGLVAGILLSISSKAFYVEVDERVSKIRECLPGANCGACGFAGCDEYAKALVENNAKTNLCTPGADAVAAQICGILGVEATDVIEMKAVVHCNGNCEATSKDFDYKGIPTCSAASMVFGGPNACKYGCLGCGDCANVCPVNAICIKDGIAHIDSRVCIGCGLCAKTCPKDIISMVPQMATVEVLCSSKDKGAVARKKCKNACIGCKKCELNCPAQAIKVENNIAVIDYTKCTDCGLCVENCPTKCIKKA